ncbi:hypothetical protein JST56_00275 [Candidatus Dependentiae bacterium]|nr:hypothetical protein [Candidatus Dependentiae bacterium]
MIKLGIVGFGVVGKSALSFLNTHRGDARLRELLGDIDYQISVWDQRLLKPHEQVLLDAASAQFAHESVMSLEQFFISCDRVLPSPGVDVRSVAHYHDKLICELDIFSLFFKKPVIAITGSLGKTTTTIVFAKMLEKLSMFMPEKHSTPTLLEQGAQRVAVGGNIGIGMLDLAAQSDNFDCAVLELSSWQLEGSKRFAPDCGVWTNLYPNHLDRHETMVRYAQAKFNLIEQQAAQQCAVLPFDLLIGEVGKHVCSWLELSPVQVVVTSMTPVSLDVVHEYVKNCVAIIMIQDQDVVLNVYEGNDVKQRATLAQAQELLTVTFLENWLSIMGALFALSKNSEFLVKYLPMVLSEVLDNPYAKHRVEHFATVKNVDFYNDSKSTVIQATQAAVKKLSREERPIILILGGLSKGVDRSGLMMFLADLTSIKKIYSFGEAYDLVPASYFSTLDDVVRDVMNCMEPGDIVLLSPSGSSYDLFENYQQRGDVFKELVLRYSESV